MVTPDQRLGVIYALLFISLYHTDCCICIMAQSVPISTACQICPHAHICAFKRTKIYVGYMTAFSHAVERCFNTLRKEGDRAWAAKNQTKTKPKPNKQNPNLLHCLPLADSPERGNKVPGHKHCNSNSEPSKKPLSPLFAQEMEAYSK